MLKNTLESYKPQEQELYGIYRGVVEDNEDPEELGRCKIRIWGIHTKEIEKTPTEGVPTDELPWAEPILSLFEGSVSGFGAWTVPLQGSHVMVFFEAGHIMQPRFFASVPGKPTEPPDSSEGFWDPDEIYPIESNEPPHKPNELGESDFHRLARGDKSDTIVESKEDELDLGIPIALGGDWDEPDPYYAAEYPKNKVFATRKGITIEIDDTDGEERIHIYHPSNSYIEINHEGSVVIRNAKDKFEIVDENKKTHIMSDYDRTVDDDRTSKVGKDEKEEIGMDRTREIGMNNDDTVGINEHRKIGVNRTFDVGANKTDTVGATETRTIGGTFTETAGGNHTTLAPIIFLN